MMVMKAFKLSREIKNSFSSFRYCDSSGCCFQTWAMKKSQLISNDDGFMTMLKAKPPTKPSSNHREDDNDGGNVNRLLI